jgi:hypothetical protein
MPKTLAGSLLIATLTVASGARAEGASCALTPRDLRIHDARRGEALLGLLTIAAFVARAYDKHATRSGRSRPSSG